jgi:hypothetical protein
MIIKFACPKGCMHYEKEENDSQVALRYCSFCGAKMRLANLDEMVIEEIKKDVKLKVDKWMRELGIEGCIEVIERESTRPFIKFFYQELQSRGLDNAKWIL